MYTQCRWRPLWLRLAVHLNIYACSIMTPAFFFVTFTFKKLSRSSQLSGTLAKNPLPIQFTQFTHSYNLLKWTIHKKKRTPSEKKVKLEV
jgi:hypothetical protein